MKLLVLGDLNGKVPTLKKSVVCDAILLTGNICSKKTAELFFNAEKKEKTTLRKHLAQEFLSLMASLNELQLPIFYVTGTYEQFKLTKTESTKLEKYRYCVCCDDSLIELEDFAIIGHGKEHDVTYPESKETIPMYTKAQIRSVILEYSKRFDKIEKQFVKATEHEKQTILLTHASPYSTKFDVVQDAIHGEQHKGSQLIRRIIQSHKPVCCVCGETTQVAQKGRVEKTLCVNPGTYAKGKRYILDTDSWKVEEL